jgi:hypothetical protein
MLSDFEPYYLLFLTIDGLIPYSGSSAYLQTSHCPLPYLLVGDWPQGLSRVAQRRQLMLRTLSAGGLSLLPSQTATPRRAAP